MAKPRGSDRRRKLLYCGVAVIGLLGGAEVRAQMTSGDQLPEAIRGIKPAAAVCSRDDVGVKPTAASLAPEVRPDLRCALDVPAVASLRVRSDVALIDLRPSSEFQAFHIDGALNLSRSELHAKPYWRSKTAVLVGDGRAERELYVECARLHQIGYRDVHVLHGGIPQWLAQGEPVFGRAPSFGKLARLSAEALWLEARNPDNLVVLSKEQGDLEKELPFSVVLPKTTSEAIEAIIARRRRELKDAPLTAVVLATEPTITDEQIEHLRQALLSTPLLVYAGTRKSFIRQTAVQKAVWLAHERGPKRPRCGM